MEHVVTVKPTGYPREFMAVCTCGDRRDNAFKWIALWMQCHYVKEGYITAEPGQGLIVDTIAGNGLNRKGVL